MWHQGCDLVRKVALYVYEYYLHTMCRCAGPKRLMTVTRLAHNTNNGSLQPFCATLFPLCMACGLTSCAQGCAQRRAQMGPHTGQPIARQQGAKHRPASLSLYFCLENRIAFPHPLSTAF